MTAIHDTAHRESVDVTATIAWDLRGAPYGPI
jgi:hypothetical protein